MGLTNDQFLQNIYMYFSYVSAYVLINVLPMLINSYIVKLNLHSTVLYTVKTQYTVKKG
jgi:hypothetical protein